MPRGGVPALRKIKHLAKEWDIERPAVSREIGFKVSHRIRAKAGNLPVQRPGRITAQRASQERRASALPLAAPARHHPTMARSYRSIVRDYQRQYAHQVRLRNTGDWRSDHTGRAHYMVTGGPLVWWHEGTDESIFGFATAEQAAAFQRWADTCGIDWTVEPRAQPLPHPEPPPERPRTYGPSPTGRTGR